MYDDDINRHKTPSSRVGTDSERSRAAAPVAVLSKFQNARESRAESCAARRNAFQGVRARGQPAARANTTIVRRACLPVLVSQHVKRTFTPTRPAYYRTLLHAHKHAQTHRTHRRAAFRRIRVKSVRVFGSSIRCAPRRQTLLSVREYDFIDKFFFQKHFKDVLPTKMF